AVVQGASLICLLSSTDEVQPLRTFEPFLCAATRRVLAATHPWHCWVGARGRQPAPLRRPRRAEPSLAWKCLASDPTMGAQRRAVARAAQRAPYKNPAGRRPLIPW